jgi:hypothetical protein
MNTERQVASLCFLGLGFCLSLAIISLLVGIEASRAGDKYDGILQISGESKSNPKENTQARDRVVGQWTTRCQSQVENGGNHCGTCGEASIVSTPFSDPQKDGEPSYNYVVTGHVYGCDSREGFLHESNAPSNHEEGSPYRRGGVRVQIGA